MSTVVVVRKNGEAVIAADTLTKWGASKESAAYVVNHEKINRVGENYLGLTGHASGNLMLEDYFAKMRREVRLDTPLRIFQTWVEMHSVLKEKYHLRAEDDDDDAVESSRLSALIVNPSGIFGVDSDRTVEEYTRFYAYGSGGDFAMGAMYATYDDPSRSAADIARLAVEAAADFDDATGLPITLYTVALRAG
ncbi:MAG TPA: hypothetical protein VGM37_06225 [Armatimonadota bacterium]|jgi:ATP-dependent protease HslVU (ClpYQ) peptidase subunit